MSEIHLKGTVLAVTERCTLKCKLCFAYIPYHENPRDMTMTEIEKVLERYFSIVDTVETFGITGGECFMHKDLVEILELVDSYKQQILKGIDIVTNGTLMPSEKLVHYLRNNKDRVRVIISNYGVHSAKVADIEEIFKKEEINYRIDSYSGDNLFHGGWVDMRDHSLKHHTQEEIENQGRRCFFRNRKNYTIRKGELHNCGRSYWRITTGIVPRIPGEYVNLLDPVETIEEQRRQLIELEQKICVSSCAYCMGITDKTERHIPAEQL